MREIKFRAWDENNKIMHNDFQFIKSGNEGNDWIVFTSDKQKLSDKQHPFQNPYFQQQLKTMQYTGLKDKNGVEIYEGDIVLDCMTKATMQVKFGQNKNMAYHGWYCEYVNLDIRHTSINGDYDTNQNNMIEVIGNIHQNPELLNA